MRQWFRMDDELRIALDGGNLLLNRLHTGGVIVDLDGQLNLM